MIEYQLKARCFVHGGNKDSLESIMERIDDALRRTHIRDLERRVRAAWQTINRLDPRRCVPALKELDAVLNVSRFGGVGDGV